jgi:rhamnulose-1-phosphate aldolase
MALEPPFPELDEFLAAIGAAGQRVSEIAASEGAAGNISICIGWPTEVRRRFPISEPIELPLSAPALAGRSMIVSGSGRRLRDIHLDPAAHLGVVVIVHNDQVARSGTNFHALIHAQPPHLTYLSHIGAYREQDYINRRLLRWEPETIVNLPEGIGVLPYRLPGSPSMMEANLQGLRDYRIVVWSKHGVMARSDQSVTKAADRIEYAETAALYEYMDLVNGSKAEGLTEDELREVVRAFDVPTSLV